jgi:hypothetical protein
MNYDIENADVPSAFAVTVSTPFVAPPKAATCPSRDEVTLNFTSDL